MFKYTQNNQNVSIKSHLEHNFEPLWIEISFGSGSHKNTKGNLSNLNQYSFIIMCNKIPRKIHCSTLFLRRCNYFTFFLNDILGCKNCNIFKSLLTLQYSLKVANVPLMPGISCFQSASSTRLGPWFSIY